MYGRHPQHHPAFGKTHWYKKEFSGIGDSSAEPAASFELPPRWHHGHQHDVILGEAGLSEEWEDNDSMAARRKTVEFDIESGRRYDEHVRGLAKVRVAAEDVSRLVFGLKEEYAQFQQLQRTFVQALQRSLSSALSRNNVFHVTTLQHVYILHRDYCEHATDRRILAQFLTICDKLNNIRERLWNLEIDSEPVCRLLRSLDRSISKNAYLSLGTLSRPSSTAQAKRALTSRPSSARANRPASAAHAVASAAWQDQIRGNVNRLGLDESSSVVGSLVSLVPLTIGTINDVLKEMDKWCSNTVYQVASDRAMTPNTRRNLADFVHDRRAELLNSDRRAELLNRHATENKVPLDHNDRIIIPTKYQESYHERVVTPTKYRRSPVRSTSQLSLNRERHGALEKYEPGDRIIIPTKYQYVPTSQINLNIGGRRSVTSRYKDSSGTQTVSDGSMQKSINKYLGYRPKLEQPVWRR